VKRGTRGEDDVVVPLLCTGFASWFLNLVIAVSAAFTGACLQNWPAGIEEGVT